MKKVFAIFLLLFAFLVPQELVVVASTPSQVIIINTATNKLAFFEYGNLVREFPVGTGKQSTPTPQGKFSIVNKIKNRPYYKGGIPGGDPRNPLGDRWLGMNIYGTPGNTYAIHGNNNEDSIGGWVSSGCVRMYNADVRWLFDRVNVNTTVIIKASQSSYQDIAASYGISLSYGAPKGVIDSPVPGTTLRGDHTVSGWFLDGSGVAKIEVLVDGEVVGRAAYGDARPDVKRAYPEYNNGHAGYHYTLDTTKFSSGTHRITIRETGANGQVITLPDRIVTISSAQGYMDNPAPDETMSGSYNVSGWFLDESGVAKIEVLIDGKVIGEASYGDARPDVQRAYPRYNNANAGYQYTLNTTLLSEGMHRITVRETGKNGMVMTLPERSIQVLNAVGYIDNPSSEELISGIYNVSGWFVEKSGVAKVEVLVDGKAAGEAIYGDARPDVKRALPYFNNENAGYHYALDTAKFSEGTHRIAVKGIGKNGKMTILPERTVTIQNVLGYLDSPAPERTLSGKIDVAGWFLDTNHVAKIEVLVDDQVVGEAEYGEARPDVKRAFPRFNNGNAGYRYTLDTTKFNDGSHTITVKETGKNGKVTTLSKRTVKVQNVLGYVDSPAPNTTLSGKYNVSGWFVDKSGVAKVEVLVDGKVVGEAIYGEVRPDVKRAFPEFHNENAGYRYNWDTAAFSVGAHTITVRETNKNGKVTTLPERNITIKNVH